MSILAFYTVSSLYNLVRKHKAIVVARWQSATVGTHMILIVGTLLAASSKYINGANMSYKSLLLNLLEQPLVPPVT